MTSLEEYSKWSNLCTDSESESDDTVKPEKTKICSDKPRVLETEEEVLQFFAKSMLKESEGKLVIDFSKLTAYL